MPTKTNPPHALKLSRETLRNLADEEGGVRISFYLPLEKAPDQSRQNAIRLKDMRKAADEALLDRGADDEGIRNWLKSIDDLIEEPIVLQRSCEAVALFLDGKECRMIELPDKMEASFHIGSRFYLLPLMQYAEADGQCWILTLSQKEVTMRKCGLVDCEIVEVPGMPTRIEAVTENDDPERSLQHHTSVTQSAAGRAGSEAGATIHGQGMPENVREEQENRFYGAIAAKVSQFFSGQSVTLLLIGEENGLGKFSRQADLAQHTVSRHTMHPQNLDEGMLQALGRRLLHDVASGQKELFKEKVASASPQKATFSLLSAVPAARHGRVAACIVACDRSLPAEINMKDGTISRLGPELKTDCVHEVDDIVAQETLRKGGQVFTALTENVPGDDGMAALLRY